MKVIAWLFIVLLLGTGIWYYASHRRSVTTPAPDSVVQQELDQRKTIQTIRSQVTAFGSVLQNVSLLSPTASADIEQGYAPYVTRSLRSAWEAHPDTALGRQTSSPWPDHIDVVSIDAAPNNTWTVRAMLVYMTSDEEQKGGDAGSSTMQLIVIDEDGHWKIDSTTIVQQNKPNMPRSDANKPQLE